MDAAYGPANEDLTPADTEGIEMMENNDTLRIVAEAAAAVAACVATVAVLMLPVLAALQ